MKYFILTLRWILFLPISALAQWLLAKILPFIGVIVGWLLGYIKGESERKFDTFYMLGVGDDIYDSITILFTFGFTMIVGVGISSYVGGIIAPNKPKNVVPTIFGFTSAVTCIIQGVKLWNSEHWFFSLLIEAILAFTVLASIIGSVGGQENSFLNNDK